MSHPTGQYEPEPEQEPDDMRPHQREAYEKVKQLLKEHFECAVVMVDYDITLPGGDGGSSRESDYMGGRMRSLGLMEYCCAKVKG